MNRGLNHLDHQGGVGSAGITLLILLYWSVDDRQVRLRDASRQPQSELTAKHPLVGKHFREHGRQDANRPVVRRESRHLLDYQTFDQFGSRLESKRIFAR
jgi:hypothetical protein